jgi:hypothetical protein
MTLVESRRLRPGDRVRCGDALGTVAFTNWTHLRITWDDERPSQPVRHEAIADRLRLQTHNR